MARPTCNVIGCDMPADWYLPADEKRDAFYFCERHTFDRRGYVRLIDAEDDE